MPESARSGRLHLAFLAVAAALLFAACGGDPQPGHDATSGATTAPAAASAAVGLATATAPSAAEETAIAPRADGLDGAPVPAPTAQQSGFEADRVDATAGTFPPLDFPRVVRAAEADWLDGDDIVLGAVHNGEARAYPLFMMTLHHVSNDELGGDPYLVTF
jgi:hypothetical protein